MDFDKTSILDGVKKMLAIDKDYDAFDDELIMHINSVLATLNQLGVGPEEGFHITGRDETWFSFMGHDDRLNDVRTYVYLRLRLIFDPPTSGFGVTSIKEQTKELEWRINVTRENGKMNSI